MRTTRYEIETRTKCGWEPMTDPMGENDFATADEAEAAIDSLFQPGGFAADERSDFRVVASNDAEDDQR